MNDADCDSLDAFLADFDIGEPESEPYVRLDDPGDDTPEDFWESLNLEPKPVVRTGDPEEQVRRIFDAVPEANEAYVRDLVLQSSDEFIDALLSRMSKRARFVRDNILRKGGVTGIEIKDQYGINGMAIRDLVEIGVPLTKRTEKGSNGRVTSWYTFDPREFNTLQEARNCLSPKLRDQLFEQHNYICGNCGRTYGKHRLQADHLIPHRMVGNSIAKVEGLAAFQPLCTSCNNAKNTSCKWCPNMADKNLDVCRTCALASPKKYTHIATKHERRITLVAQNQEEMITLAEIVQLAIERGLITPVQFNVLGL
jgi:hypothetical protein